MTSCPVCGGLDCPDTVRRPQLPAMQNYVQRTREEALSAPRGVLTLAACRSCGFAWNRTFDPELLVYDEGYDNAVPSAVMQVHYAELVEWLRTRYPLDDGLIVDVGCGDGAFLRRLCAAAPSSRGLGIDPALDRDRVEEGGRVRLVKAPFAADLLSEAPALVVSRHVLEHMSKPVEFLDLIADALAEFGPSPAYFEVPDLSWIVEHGAFWDFCYEHSNYFTGDSFAAALRRAGFEVVRSRVGFGTQYLLVEAVSGRPRVHVGDGAGGDLVEGLQHYAAAEAERIASTRELLAGRRREGSIVVVWGMATKGVLFSNLVDPERSVIDVCIDVNENKQGCYVPVTGHRIDPPEVLRGRGALSVVVMNENYRAEIEETCRALGVDATFVALEGARTPAPHVA